MASGYQFNSINYKAFNPILIKEQSPYNIGDCPIVAIEYDGFSPNKIINIKSKENAIYENTIDFHKVEFLEFSGEYPLSSKHYVFHEAYGDKIQYLITDQFSDSQNGKPLFYQYELLFDTYSTISGVVIKNIYKNNEIKIDKTEYKIQYSVDTLADENLRYSDTVWGEVTPSKTHRVRLLLPYYFASISDFFTVEYDKYIYGSQSYQKELIEIKPLYSKTDYELSSEGLTLTESSKIAENKSIAIIKDPNSRINPLDIITIKGENLYLSDKISQWKLRLNLGSFYVPPGIYNTTSGYFYNLEQTAETNVIAVTNIKPFQINSNILQVKEVPIYIDETLYSYPLYKIDTYHKNTEELIDQSGKFAIDVNGQTRDDIKIKSIDRQKGFIELDTELNSTDEIDLYFYINNSGFLLLENLELNPKVQDSGAAFSITDYPHGFGIAISPWEETIVSRYPYIYSLSSPTEGYQIPDIGESGVYMELDSSFFTICHVDLNKLTTDIVKITDARKVGGGLVQNKNLDNWFTKNYSGIYEHEKTWYTDIGNYDGKPLAHNSVIIIHIPENLINTMRNKWINSYKEQLEYDAAEVAGDKEFKFYLDQTIRKYISAGTDYIIVPTISGQITNKFLSLR